MLYKNCFIFKNRRVSLIYKCVTLNSTEGLAEGEEGKNK
jgi:hypothetical protein